MAIVDGLRANAANTNARLMSRTQDTSTVGKVDLENTDPVSGPIVDNVQQEINSLNAFTGRPAASAFDDTPAWVSNEVGTALDNIKDRIEAIDAEFADLTPHVVDASVTDRGVVSTGTQSFAGDKTFTGTIAASNLSGTNTGDVTLDIVGSTPNANAATLVGQELILEPADASFPGVVTTGTQSFAGNKTFTGTVSASNISGTNTGDVTLTAIGSTPNANGATLTAQAINLEPASASFGGVMTAIAQIIGGIKTFASGIIAQTSLLISGILSLDTEIDSATTGSLQTLDLTDKTILRVTNIGLVSVEGITAPTTNQQFVLMNVTGGDIDLVHLSGTAANQIHTGSGTDLTMADGQAVTLLYDLTSAVWRVIGGGGAGGGGSVALYNANFTGASITTTADAFQKYTYTGTNGIAHQLTTLNFTLMPDGGRLVIVGTDDTNVVTIIAFAITNVRSNGDWTGSQWSSIEFIKSGSELLEVSRNGY